MKRIAIIPVLGGALLLLASCYMLSVQQKGSVSIALGQSADRAALSLGVTQPTPTKARVMLYSYISSTNYSLYTFPDTGTTYTETSYPGTVTLSNIPVGEYEAIVQLGNDGSNGSFQTSDYGISSVFDVQGGANASVSVTTKVSPFTSSVDLLGKNLLGVRVVSVSGEGNDLFAASGDTLYSGSAGATLSSSGSITKDASSSQIQSKGLSVASLAVGYADGLSPTTQYLFLSTNKGIVPFDGTTFDTSFSSNLKDTSGNRYSVLQSGAVETTDGGISIFYQRDHGFGGIALGSLNPTPNSSGSKWIDDDLSGKIIGKPFYDMALNDTAVSTSAYIYFASKIGAFRADTSLISPNSDVVNDLNSYAVFFNAPNKALVQSLAVVPGSTGPIYIGTPQGAYYATLDEPNSDVISGNWTSISATSGDSITKIAVNSTGVLVAFRSLYNLYIKNGSTVTTLPFFAGLPGQLQSMTWDGTTLYIAGSQGLVSYSVAPS